MCKRCRFMSSISVAKRHLPHCVAGYFTNIQLTKKKLTFIVDITFNNILYCMQCYHVVGRFYQTATRTGNIMIKMT